VPVDGMHACMHAAAACIAAIVGGRFDGTMSKVPNSAQLCDLLAARQCESQAVLADLHFTVPSSQKC
jgi:hypothetical protein